MSVEWTSTGLPAARVLREHTAVVEGLRVHVNEGGPMGVSWTVFAHLDDFRLDAYRVGVGSIEEAKAAAVAAARRLLELGARGRPA